MNDPTWTVSCWDPRGEFNIAWGPFTTEVAVDNFIARLQKVSRYQSICVTTVNNPQDFGQPGNLVSDPQYID